MGSDLKILNLKGKVLHSIKEDSFTKYSWDGKDDNGNYLRSGVYILSSSNPEGVGSIAKLAIIREE